MEKCRSRSPRYSPNEGHGSVQMNKFYTMNCPDNSDRHSVNYRFGHRSSNIINGTPIKRLLAEEMSKESGTRRRPPGLIARLMGLDGLPNQQPGENQEKDSHRIGHMPRYNSYQDFSREEQDFKDVFEVVESRVEGRNKSSVCSRSSDLADNDVEFIMKKFISAKQLSTDATCIHDSKELENVIEDIENNPDLLLKLLEKPSGVFSMPVNGFRESRSGTRYHRGQLARRGPDNRPPRMTSRSLRNAADFHSYQTCPKHAAEQHRGSSSMSKKEYECNALPTRIVILKPNLEKLQHLRGNELCSGCHDFLSNPRENTEAPVSVLSSRHKFRESRDVGRQVSMKMRSASPGNQSNYCAPKFRGYAGDESSPNLSDNDSEYEAVARTLPLRNSIGKADPYGSLSSFSVESSVNREARKRLSERWEKNHKSIDMGLASRSNTLGEMLAVRHKSRRLGKYDFASGSERHYQSVIGNRLIWKESLGIRDGLKAESSLTRSRSRSAPASSTNSLKKDGFHEGFDCDRFFIPSETSLKERSKTNKPSSNPNYGSRRLTRSYPRKSQLSLSAWSERIDNSSSGMEQISALGSVPYTSINMESNLLPNGAETIDQMENQLEQDLSFSTTEDIMFTPQDGKGLQRSAVTNLVSQETDQPSPVSVLDTSFADDVSGGSECFGSLSADLQGLRMQLQLLKQESESYEEGNMVISSDEDIEDSTTGNPYENGLSGESSMQFSYINDILLRSGIDDTDSDTYAATTHTLDCPVSPHVFELMEKKYAHHLTWHKSDRKLLFDCMNLALSKICRKHTDPHPWIQASKICLHWHKNGLASDLRRLLFGQGTFIVSNTLSTETEWPDIFGDEMDIIGREIEKLLTEELITEAFPVW